MISLRLTLQCVKHPSYRGKGKPRATDCSCCDAIYTARHDPKTFIDNMFDDDVRVHLMVIDDGQDSIR